MQPFPVSSHVWIILPRSRSFVKRAPQNAALRRWDADFSASDCEAETESRSKIDQRLKGVSSGVDGDDPILNSAGDRAEPPRHGDVVYPEIGWAADLGRRPHLEIVMC
jgi:hypothetical protein